MPPPSASAAPAVRSAEDALVRFWSAPGLSEAWFAPAFLAKVPLTTLEPIRGQLAAQAGKLSKVEKAGDDYRCVFEKGSMPTKAKLDAEGRFTTLWFGPLEAPVTTVDAAVDALAALAGTTGKTSLLVLEDGKERVARNADAPLAVASTFKLAILAALREQIAAHKRSWRDVVALDPKWKSIPSGVLQSWPDGTPVTVQSLATWMISISDNTAADALLSLVGPASVERLAPGVRPFLSTRQVTVLKSPANADLLAKWRAADEAGKRALLAAVDARPLPRPDGLARALDVEWHLSARDLCALMARVQDLPLMSVNPGVASAPAWDRVAYKGGGDDGVLSTTTWLVAGKKSFCVSATWNDDADLQPTRFFAAYGALMRALHP